MSVAKIEFEIGNIRFSGEGDQAWLGQQLDKIIDRAEELIKLAPSQKAGDPGGQSGSLPPDNSDIAQKTLPAFLKDKNATKKQVRKFLATAAWLQAKGGKRLKTGDVTSALKDSNQTRLNNASDCLSQNVAKGYCEKDGAEFFVTQDGMESL
ncbi:MAG: hypothetical protein K9K66_00625 [Desulfarculaceae bacterium]|nr:hypothetical protein [Desulfarculaceae bacterium]MCF8072216.1 hypothetical protein [Desulfarculaceae bacterium]MCF8100137.1 hypothetical protein [Desulfarculaceae bacterium]MCF8117214.1 hypothetical protein [Desulfarculaceae bacterium]